MLRFLGALGFCCVLLTGCLDPAKQAQIAAENEKERDLEVRTVGNIADVINLGPMKVDGVGLVTGLAGTGHCPAGYYRDMMEQYLLKHRGSPGGEISHTDHQLKVRQILDDPNNALVIVTGLIPNGARKGDKFDVEISLPIHSKTESLAGGYLEACTLRVITTTGSLSGKQQGNSTPISGHILGMAKGPLVVGFGDTTDIHELKRARVWQGGTSRVDRPYAFKMRNDESTLQYANKLARRINFMYQEDARSRAKHADFTDKESQYVALGSATSQLNSKQDPFGMVPGEIAKATKECVINVRVPMAYRLDHERFLIVASNTPLEARDQDLPRYRQRLQKMLLDARDTQRAAIRLEALGRDSVSLLLPGLESDHPFVRFVSAEALTYLGSTAGVEVLTKLAQQYPIFAKNATIALANLGETICRDRLADLLGCDEPAVRCAAFHALSLIDEADPRLGGQHVNDAFWLYRVPHAAKPMVYFSTGKRPQVVLFGRNIVLSPETRMFVGKDFTVAHDEKQGKFLVKRITTRGEQKRVCSNRLDEVLVALAELGAAYPDIVDCLRKAQDYQRASCPIVHWQTPDVSLETLVETGRSLK